MTRYFEDFHVGDTYDLGSTSATQEEIIAFARQFDPQPFHTDPERAKHSTFGTLVAWVLRVYTRYVGYVLFIQRKSCTDDSSL